MRRPPARRRRTTAAAASSLVVAVALLASCAATDDAREPGEDETRSLDEEATPVEPLTGDLVVFAASSLQGVFTELGETFEELHPGVTVTFSFAASSALVEQVAAGAPVDVLATADAATMERVAAQVLDPMAFAANTLVIVMPPNSQGGVTDLTDFANPDLTLAVCAVEVPCGAAAQEVFAVAGITPSVDTYAQNAAAALNLAVSGEVDASLVYATDGLAADDAVITVQVPEAAGVVNEAVLAVAVDAPHPAAAEAWVDLVRSPEGWAVLEAAGFDQP